MAITLILILVFIVYDSIVPQKDSVYPGKVISLSGKVTEITKYDPPFGERTFRLRLDNGPKELPAFFVKIKESRLLKACSLERDDGDVYIYRLENVLYGRDIRCRGEFNNFEAPANPGQFDSKSYYKNEGLLGVLKADEISLQRNSHSFSPDIYLHKLNLSISEKYQKLLGIRDAGSLSAMVLGDKRNLDEEIKELYQENSISHLLAISGLHISLVAGAVYLFLKKLKISFKFPLFFASIILFTYGMFTGFSISTTRAVIMMCMFFFSFLLGRSYDLPNSLAVSAIIQMFINHRVIYQISFQLSFLAVIGIFYIMPELMYIFKIDYKNKKGINKVFLMVLSSIICSISINIASLPVILANFYELSLIGVFLNIIVIPLMSILVITGLLGGFVSLITEAAGKFILGASYYILNIYTFLCKIGNNFTSLRLILGKPEKWQIITYYILIFLIFYFLSHKRRLEKIKILKNNTVLPFKMFKRIFVTILTLSLGFFILVYKKEEFSLNMLDIGQGDCFVISDEHKNIYISDCGSTTVDKAGKQRLLPFLKSKGWKRINTIFVSHMDKDHVNGVNDLLKCPEITIDKIIISVSYKSDNLNCTELEELKALTKDRKINLLYMKKGDEIRSGDLGFKCLYPTGNEHIEDQNEASIVMRMEYKGISVLFTGDIAGTTEEEVMKLTDKETLDCDILKVCHHGSKNSSSPEFLKNVDPKFYLISCGLMNRYGHPHKAALERMAEEGGKIFRTDHMGAVEIKLKNKQFVVRYNSKDLSDKDFVPAKECDCEDCTKVKVSTHLKKGNGE